MLADVAFIGLPNAGKSTLIAAVSAARPKIAAYPFTTLVPNLGVVRLDASHLFVAADIPGLIRGAHKGHGLGHQFLKHIERSPVFVHLLDPLLPHALRSFASINRELKKWNPELVQRPQLVALTKMDLVDEETEPVVAAIEARLRAEGLEVFRISAATGEGLEPLLWRVMHFVDLESDKRAAATDEEPTTLVRAPLDKPVEITEIARYATA